MQKITKFICLIMTMFIYTLNVSASDAIITKGNKLATLQFTNSKEEVELYSYTSNSTTEPVYTYNPKNTDINGLMYISSTNYEINRNLSKKLEFIAYFGYKYKDRTDISWYLVTQNLIWNTCLDNQDTLNFKDTITEEEYQEKANIILKDIEDIYKFPSFEEKPSEIDYTNIKHIMRTNEEYILTDTNNLLANFYLETDDSFTYQISGNKLKLNFLYPTTKLLSLDQYSEGMAYVDVYERANSYVAFSRGYVKKPNCYILVKSLYPSVTLNLNKQKSYYPALDSVKYGLYYENDYLFKEFKLNNDNKHYIEEVYPGNYYIKEINNAYGYLANTEKIPFNMPSEDYSLKEVSLTKEPMLKTINFQKNLKDIEGNIIPLSDTDFRVLDKNKQEIFTFRTNEEGSFLLNLPYDNFYIEQIDNNSGYLNEIIELTVNENTEEDLTIESKEIIGTVNLSFKDYLSKNLIKGATSFKIKRVNTRMNDELTYEITNGEVKLEDLPLGNYQITDITIPDNYHLATKEVDFSITETENNVDLTIYSELKTGSLKLTYLDKLTNKPIEGGIFKVFNELNECLYEEKTNVLGVIEIKDIPLGNYYLKQVLSTSNDLDSEKISLEVKENIETNITIQDRSEVEVPITGKKTTKYSNMFLGVLLSGLIFYEKKKA